MTSTLRRLNIVASTVLALLGAGAVYGGVGYGIFLEDGQVGPGFLPALCGAAIFVLALIDLVHQIRRTPELETFGEEIIDDIVDNLPDTTDRLQVPSDIDIFGRDQKTRNRQLAMVMIGLVVAIALVPVLGLLISLALLMLFVSIFVEKRVWWSALAITAGTILFIYLVFGLFLNVPFPTSFLGVI